MYNQIENILVNSVYQCAQFPVILCRVFTYLCWVTHPSQKDTLQTLSGDPKES